LVQGLEATDDGKQLKSFAAGCGLFVGGFGGCLTSGRAKDESPALGGTIVSTGSQSGFRIKQEVRGGNAHRRRQALERGKG
jgi:hypothetical protein